MKKYVSFLLLYFTITLAMSFIVISPSKNHKHKAKSIKSGLVSNKPTCSCGTSAMVTGSLSGGSATVSWAAVAGAVNYSLGGYFQCGGNFFYCVSGTSKTFRLLATEHFG